MIRTQVQLLEDPSWKAMSRLPAGSVPVLPLFPGKVTVGVLEACDEP